MPLTPDQLTTFTRALAIDRAPLGLVVTTDDPGAVILPAPGDSADVIAVRADTDPESVIAHLALCGREGRWCRLHLLDGTLPGHVYNQLRSIATTGHCADRSGDDIAWPATAKCVVLASRDALERITIPTFLNLFGPVLRED